MRALIMSDTHGLSYDMNRIISSIKPDITFHCGDFCVDEKTLPQEAFHTVRGNCDNYSDIPLSKFVDWNGLRFFMVHGHEHSVKSSLLPLKYKAIENSANIVLFGHSHIPFCDQESGFLFINPGSVASPRLYKEPTFVVLEAINRDAEEGTTVRVDYYNTRFDKKNDLGGQFIIKNYQ